jgi:hypothetical protein
MSVFSYPERGKWGKSAWRGNCSGYMYRDLFLHLQPKFFIDPMMGSGTSIEVAEEMGIEALGLDIHHGFDILKDSILAKAGKEADLVLSHPPYGSMIFYSDNVNDLSRCNDDEDFHQKMQIALLNQREATKPGGFYGTIIGDWRRNGQYTSYQAECIARMPKAELMAVLIKQQHNTMSDLKQYARMKFPRILHEYVLIWRRASRNTYQLLGLLANEQAERLRGTWRSIVRSVMISLGGKATLADLYQKVASGCPERVKTNQNWQAKVRQIVNSTGEYTSSERGVWQLA